MVNNDGEEVKGMDKLVKKGTYHSKMNVYIFSCTT